MRSSRLNNGSQGNKLHIAVLGLGHVGLPTALGFAELGWTVTGADSDATKVALMQRGQVPFHEDGLPELLRKHLASTEFRLSGNVEGAIREASVLFICVGTPQGKNGDADLSQIDGLARTIARNLNGYKLIVEKSTVPAITGQWIKKTIARHSVVQTQEVPANGRISEKSTGRADGSSHRANGSLTKDPQARFEVASNPEFLQEGTAVRDFFCPDRIVCGVESERARSILNRLYSSLNRPILFTDLNTAELIKHTANAFLSMKVSFINMVADICESVNADVEKVADGIGLDSRIGRSFLNAGIGFGGYCFPKDLRAFIRLAESHNIDVPLLRATEQINHSRVERIIKKMREALWITRGKTIGILGLSFKPGTDDIREAPSLRVIEELLKEGAILQLYDPKAITNTKQVLPERPGSVMYCENPYEAARDAHAVLVLTEWDEFRRLDLRRLAASMSFPILIDGRNVYDFDRVREAGLEYFCMGRSGLSKASANVAHTRPPKFPRKRSKSTRLPEAAPTANAAASTAMD